jgi:hypothetical protein
MSAIVALIVRNWMVIGISSLILRVPLVFTIVVVNFIGGYITYIGAFLGGGLAVLVALGDGGIVTATIMLVVVLADGCAATVADSPSSTPARRLIHQGAPCCTFTRSPLTRSNPAISTILNGTLGTKHF